MAHAHAELTGQLGVAMVTAGPGVTNTVTGDRQRHRSRASRCCLIGGCTSRPQANMGPLQDIPHVDILRPVTRYARTAARRRAGDPRAGRGDRRAPWANAASPARSISRSRPTCCARTCRRQLVLDDWMRAEAAAHACRPTRRDRSRGRRRLVGASVRWSMTGRGAAQAGAELVRLLDRTRRASISTPRKAAASCRPSTRPWSAPMRARGDDRGRPRARRSAASSTTRSATARRRCFRTPASSASPTAPGELIDNRRGDPELLATPAAGTGARWSRRPATASPRSTRSGPRGCAGAIRSAPRRLPATMASATARQRRQGPSGRDLRGASGRWRPRTTSRSPMAATS